MFSYLLSTCFFLIGYFYMLYQSILEPMVYGKYTYWAYVELLLLLPLMPYFRAARHIAIINSFGLAMGIQSFYIASKYEFINDARKNQISILQNPIIFMICDTIIHWGPFTILYILSDFTLTNINIYNCWIGLLTGLCHVTFSYCIIGLMNPSILYNIDPNKYKKWQINTAWSLLFVFHVFGAIMIN